LLPYIIGSPSSTSSVREEPRHRRSLRRYNQRSRRSIGRMIGVVASQRLSLQ
jgi:hypothetical protein